MILKNEDTIVWIELSKRTSVFFLYFGSGVLSITLLYWFFSWLHNSSYMETFLNSVAVFIIAYLAQSFLVKWKNSIKGELFPELPNKDGAWDRFTGEIPQQAGKINIKYNNGSIDWNINPTKVDWDAAGDNGVFSYYKK